VAKVVIRKQKEDKANSIKVTWDFATERGLLRLSSILLEIFQSNNDGNENRVSGGDAYAQIKRQSKRAKRQTKKGGKNQCSR